MRLLIAHPASPVASYVSLGQKENLHREDHARHFGEDCKQAGVARRRTADSISVETMAMTPAVGLARLFGVTIDPHRNRSTRFFP
jgi:hypothetical protein